MKVVTEGVYSSTRGTILHRYDKDTELRIAIPNSAEAVCEECLCSLYKKKSLAIYHRQKTLYRSCFGCSYNKDIEKFIVGLADND